MGQANPPKGSIRRLAEADRPLLRDHLLRLDADTRRSRFAMGAGDSFLERYAEQAFAHGALLFGYFEDGRLRALAELRPLDGRNAEAAFSIETPFGRRGIGTALFGRLLEAARSRGLKRLYMNCLVHNRAMQALARKFSAELTFESDTVLGVLDDDAARGTSAGAAFTTAVLPLQSRWRGLFNRPPRLPEF